jgi:hypothetical protein
MAQAGRNGVPPATADLPSRLPWQRPGRPQSATSLAQITGRTLSGRPTGDPGQSRQAHGRCGRREVRPRRPTARHGRPTPPPGGDQTTAHPARLDTETGQDGATPAGHPNGLSPCSKSLLGIGGAPRRGAGGARRAGPLARPAVGGDPGRRRDSRFPTRRHRGCDVPLGLPESVVSSA